MPGTNVNACAVIINPIRLVVPPVLVDHIVPTKSRTYFSRLLMHMKSEIYSDGSFVKVILLQRLATNNLISALMGIIGSLLPEGVAEKW